MSLRGRRAAGERDRGGREPFAHLGPDNRERLTIVMRDLVPEVFRLNRIIEQRTGYHSQIGQHMLVDVLSHLGTLASRPDLSARDQATQISKIEEHLRRAIIEHPEEVVRNRIAEVRRLWSDYQREAFLYRREGKLGGAPRHQDLEEKRASIDSLLESARKAKPDETTWDESQDAAAAMTEAAHTAGELADALEQCIGIAQRVRRDEEQANEERRRGRSAGVRWAVGIAVAIAIAVAGYVVGESRGKDDPSPRGHTVSAPKTAP